VAATGAPTRGGGREKSRGKPDETGTAHILARENARKHVSRELPDKSDYTKDHRDGEINWKGRAKKEIHLVLT